MPKLNLFIQEKKKITAARNDKVAAKIKESFSMALVKKDFPVLPGHEEESKLKAFVTLTYVSVTADLRNATIFFTTLNNMYKDETLKFFELQQHYFKNIIAKKLKLRFIPNIKFKFDNTFDYYDKIDNILKNI